MMECRHERGQTRFEYYFDGCESVLFHLRPGRSSQSARFQTRPQTILRKEYKQVEDVSRIETIEPFPSLYRLTYAPL
jgi:hypothetical protein